MPLDRYALNTALEDMLTLRFGITLEDEDLNELTHRVADFLEGER